MSEVSHYNPCRMRGFSLVEIAVVLVIIGLILAAVLQGRQLIASAEYKSLKSQLSEYRTAFYTFRDRYDALPGDFADAPARLGVPSATDGDEGNGIIDDGPGCANDADETCLAWQHLRAADMLGGNPEDKGADAPPDHTYGGLVESFFTGSNGNGSYGHKIEVTDLPVDIAQQLDQDLDDEQCNDGRIAALDPSVGCDSGAQENWSTTADRVSIIYAL